MTDRCQQEARVDSQASRPRAADTPLLEWIASIVGLLLTVAMIGFIGWQALNGPGAEPPAIVVEVQHIVESADGFVVEIKAANRSPATAAAVQVRGVLSRGRREVATSQATIDYVPGHSERSAGLFFKEDPRAYRLEVRALGYTEP